MNDITKTKICDKCKNKYVCKYKETCTTLNSTIVSQPFEMYIECYYYKEVEK